MVEHKNFKQESRNPNWGKSIGAINNDDLKVGALLRIADAAEAMAKRHTELINERDMYERLYRNADSDRVEYRKTISALKGVITKLKKKK